MPPGSHGAIRARRHTRAAGNDSSSLTADTGFCAASGTAAVTDECRRPPTGAMRGCPLTLDGAPGDADEPAVFGGPVDAAAGPAPSEERAPGAVG